MTSRDFCFWLMGSLELNENKGFDEKQTEILRNHLNMCFIHMVKEDGTLEKEGYSLPMGGFVSTTGLDTRVNC